MFPAVEQREVSVINSETTEIETDLQTLLSFSPTSILFGVVS